MIQENKKGGGGGGGGGEGRHMPWCIMTELETECVWAPKSGLRLDWLCHCALYRSMIMLTIIFGSPLNSSETMLLLTLAQIIGRIPQCLILESVSGMNIICCFFYCRWQPTCGSGECAVLLYWIVGNSPLRFSTMHPQFQP